MQKIEDILELLKKRPLSAEELEKKGKLPTEDINVVVNFLEQRGFIEEKNKRYRITEIGLQLLSLPTKTASHLLYSEKTKEASIKERKKMADRYNVEISDVDHAAWVIAKSVIWAKLEQDCAERKKEKKNERAKRTE